MKTLALAVLFTLSGSVLAQGSTLKQGLWEVKPIKQIVDGRDVAAQVAAAQAKMQQAMANMPPEKRKQMQAMMGQPGGGSRICVSAAMAARNTPMVDPEGRCQPAKLDRSGNKTSFEFNCTTNGRTMVGKGESTTSGDTIASRMDMTTTDASGRHTMQSEVQMSYLGPDCQGIKPVDEMAKGLKPR